MSQKHDNDHLHKLRHSTAHVMAQAVLDKFPGAKIAIGPAIEDGFYYDFDLPRPLTPEDLDEIQAHMKELVAQDHPFEYREISEAEARKLFADQPYKLELIAGILSGGADEYGEVSDEPPKLSIYQHGAFIDLCRGPHVTHTQEINPDHFMLLNVAGAYWRGDEQRPMLQRIYGTVWETKEQLEAYLWRREEAARRDHRRLAKELDLVSFQEEVGAGLAHWHPKGGRMRVIIEDYWRKLHYAGGYDIVFTPHIGRSYLWETSGHLDFYKDSMYAPMDIEGQEYYLKPMNCPFQIMVYKSRMRSYRDLPLRWAELGTVYRYERSGTLHGLLRVRGFTQDDAHIICTPEQIDDEILRVLDFSLNLLRGFGFEDFRFDLSVRDPANPAKYAGSDDMWSRAEASLRRALETRGLPYERMEGEAVFYGPKIDIQIRDALARTWQCTTIQFDFNLPGRFDMTYVGEDGQEHRPYVVHRALLGSLERFFALLIEHYAGAFPVWLMPVQAMVIPIADRHVAYARQVADQLRQAEIRAEVDVSSDRMQAKIRKAQLDKVPYMLIVGDREQQAEKVAVRLRTEENLGAMPLAELVQRVRQAIADRQGL